MELCKECNKREVQNKKWGMCNRCVQRKRRKEGLFLHPDDMKTPRTKQQHIHTREIEFIRNYFNHNNWHYRPALFRFNGEKYAPDFYDGEQNVFIEVSGTRQAYHYSKDKYDLFKKAFPKLKFEIRKTDGTLLDEETRDKNWDQ